MVEYTTKAELRDFGARIPIIEQAELRKSFPLTEPARSTFLSHSSKDSELVDGTIRILRQHGANVYVDSVDATLPPYTTAETAAKLKWRVQKAKRFILLATENSKNSTWVPWELGIADGYKSLEQIALFPAVEAREATTWTNWEYLGLYWRIVWGKIEGHPDGWIVLDESDQTALPLKGWLADVG